MSKPVDGRKQLTPEKRAHLEKMREAKKKKQLERLALEEKAAKQEFIDESQVKREPEPAPAVEEDVVDTPDDEEPAEILPPVKKKNSRRNPAPLFEREVDQRSALMLSEEDLALVREVARDRAMERKQKKWAQRKEEVVEEVIGRLSSGSTELFSSSRGSLFDD